VDFLLFDFGFPPFNPWPAFNVADSCICVSVGLLLLVSFQEELQRRAALKETQGR
jgi:signal peptidase II